MHRQRTYYVYIMASRNRIIYVGVAGFLMARVLRHRADEGGAFTRRYCVHRLVYFQSFRNVGDAIARETEIKGWRREKKVVLIEERNPTCEDLAEGWGGPAVMRAEGQPAAVRLQEQPAATRVEGQADSSPVASLPRRNDKEYL